RIAVVACRALHLRRTGRRAAVAIRRVAVVAGLARIDDAVAAHLRRAVDPAAVARRRIAVIALLAGIDDAVAAGEVAARAARSLAPCEAVGAIAVARARRDQRVPRRIHGDVEADIAPTLRTVHDLPPHLGAVEARQAHDRDVVAGARRAHAPGEDRIA